MKVKQKVLTVALAVVLAVAFPVMAFAATSPVNDFATHPTIHGTVGIDYSQSAGKQALTVSDTTPSAALANQAASTGSNVIYFSIVGQQIDPADLLTVSFPVAQSGIYYTIYHELLDGSIVSYNALAVNGYVTVDILELGNFGVVPMDVATSGSQATGTTGSGASSSATSPATGA